MRPKPPDPADQPELFRARLDNLVDPRHPLVRLAKLIDWRRFEDAFGALYKDGVGRPGLPTRLMVGLHLLKHMDGCRTKRFAPAISTAPMCNSSVARRSSRTRCRWTGRR